MVKEPLLSESRILNCMIANFCYIMGRTIPSYQISSQFEIMKWRPFRKLIEKLDRKKFDEMLSASHLYTGAGTVATRPVLSHAILMSIIFEHYKPLMN